MARLLAVAVGGTTYHTTFHQMQTCKPPQSDAEREVGGGMLSSKRQLSLPLLLGNQAGQHALRQFAFGASSAAGG